MKVEQAIGVAKEVYLPEHGKELSGYRGNSRPTDAPFKYVDKERVEQGIDHYRENGGIHSLLRMARCTQYGIESEVEVGDDVAEQNNFHVVCGIAHRCFAAAKEVEDRSE